MARGRVIALLGAESTGKSSLAQALGLSLRAEGLDVAVVDEHLRSFCAARGRTPRQDEQAGIAAAQQRAIAAAAARHAVVIADTTALQTAVYSRIVFGDLSLDAAALAAHRDSVDLSLLTALDLPWQADGLQRDGPQVRGPVDRALRQLLQAAGLPHAVVCGRDAARSAAALAAVRPLLGLPPTAPLAHSQEDGAPFSRWRPRCATCADAACEQQDHAARGWLPTAVRPAPPASAGPAPA